MAKAALSKVSPHTKNQGIPIVHQSRKSTGNGILDERQKRWVDGPSNDIFIENPVLYRQNQLQHSRDKVQQNDKNNSLSIRGLASDLTDPAKGSEGIIVKIQEGRRERHNAVLEDMIQELEAISLELEPQIKEACESVRLCLDSNNQEIEGKMSSLMEDQLLSTYSNEQLESFWKTLERHSNQRVAWIYDLDKTLRDIEQIRSGLIGDVFKTYVQVFERIAHLMPADVQRLIEDEMMKINLSIINNHRAYADLTKKLLTGDIEREKKQYQQYVARIDDWKNLKLALAIQQHKEYMESEDIRDPPVIKQMLKDLANRQASLNSRRIKLLEQLREMKPPASTKTAVYQWNQAITDATDQLDQLHSGFLSSLRLEHASILSKCQNFITKLKSDLFNGGIVNENILEELMQDTFLPLLGERKASFEYEEEKIEKHLMEIAAHQKQQLKTLFKFAQGAGHVWDNHELGLIKEERTLQEILDKNRREHDYQNQMKEARLDIVMDRMRQESTNEGLASTLKVALAMMEEIKDGQCSHHIETSQLICSANQRSGFCMMGTLAVKGLMEVVANSEYLEFHDQQKVLCEKYPSMVKDELKRYTTSVYGYFNVMKQNTSNQSLDEVSNRKIISTLTLSNGLLYSVFEDTDFPTDTPTGRSDILTIHTESAVIYEDEDLPVNQLPYIQNFLILPDLIGDLKNEMRLGFLEHLQNWKKEGVKRSQGVVKAKTEEIDNELDLRLHLHRPRPGRAEVDVHDVRASELILHRERVEQHCSGISEALTQLKTSFQGMLDDHARQNDMFKQSVDELEQSFSNANNTQELKALQDQVNNKLTQYMEVIRASVRQYRTNLDDMLNKLRNSNATFRKNFKIFSEGGNFSPEEVDEHRKRLEKASAKIDNCEGTLIGELEGLETKRLDVAKEFSGKLEEKFKQHLFDLTFIEKIKGWLTNIQVKIKGEVANSNSHSQRLDKMISVFRARTDRLKHASSDNGTFSVEQLHETLVPLIQAIHERVHYLNCATKREKSSFSSLQENNKGDSRKDSAKKNRLKKTSKRLSAKGRLQKSASQRSPTSTSPTSKSPTSMTSKDTIANEDSQLSECAQKPLSSFGSGRHNSGLRATQYGGKYDRKYLVFGEYNPDDDETNMNFLQLQLRLLQNGLDGLLSTVELYYRQKGQRQTTRPQSISEHFEACAETLIRRLRKYKQQTEVYHNSCIQEFRVQIKTFLQCVQDLPSLLIRSRTEKHLIITCKQKCIIETNLESKTRHLEKLQKENQLLLRPSLGHPNNKQDLKKLTERESARQKETDGNIFEYENKMKEIETEGLKEFLKSIHSVTVQLISQFDTLVTLDDVIEGVTTTKPKNEKELLKEKIYGGQKAEDLESHGSTKQSYTWEAFDITKIEENELLSGLSELLPPIMSEKRTPAHEEVILARNSVIEDVVTKTLRNLKELSIHVSKLKNDELAWKKNWDKSIKKILDLY